MPTFIDESGDTGHGAGSKPYFRLAAVWIPSLEEVERFRAAILRLRSRLGLARDYEFKFADTHSHPEWRHAFFDVALHHDFQFSVCAIDKTQGRWRTVPTREQHWAAATCIAVLLRDVYHSAERPERPLNDPVVVDRNDDRGFLGIVGTQLRGLKSRLHPALPMVQNPRFRRSHPDAAIQLVDMVCGAVGAHIDGDYEWFKKVKQRCMGVIRLGLDSTTGKW
jgi:hypothetical protein